MLGAFAGELGPVVEADGGGDGDDGSGYAERDCVSCWRYCVVRPDDNGGRAGGCCVGWTCGVVERGGEGTDEARYNHVRIEL